MKQEAQLSQTDRAALRLIQCFTKSLKVIRNDIIEYGVCKCRRIPLKLCISYRFWDIQHQIKAWHWNRG